MFRIIKNSTFYFGSDLSVKIATFLLLPLYTRFISPEDFGHIYLLISVGETLTLLLSMSLKGSISRYFFAHKEHHNIAKMYSSIVQFTFLFSSPIYILLIAAGPTIFGFIDLNFFPYVFIILVNSCLSIYYLYIASLLQARQEARKLSLVTLSTSLVNLLLTVILVIVLEDKVFAYLFSIFISGIIKFCIFVYFSIPFLVRKARDSDLKNYLVYGISRMPIELSYKVVLFADRFMIYEFQGEKDTGLYSVSYKLGSAIKLVFMAINKAYVPHLFSRFSSDGDNDYGDVAKAASRLLAFYFLVTIATIVFSKELLFLLASAYRESSLVLAVIVFSNFIVALILLFQPPMDYNVKYVRIKSLLWVLSAIVNVSLNLVLIPKYSLNGAAFATLISYLVILIPIIYYSNKAIQISYELRKILLISVISLVYFLSYFLETSIPFFLLKILLTFIYIGVLMRIVGITLDDGRDMIKKFNLK